MAGFLSRLLTTRASPENPATPLSNPAQWLVDWAEGNPTIAGEPINNRSALKMDTVWACVRVRAESFSALPFKVYERRADGGRREVRDHPLSLFKLRPNPASSGLSLREAAQAHIDTWGNGFVRIEYTGRTITGFSLIDPSTVTRIERRGAQVWYLISKDSTGDVEAVPGDRIIHVPGLSFDGVSGYSVIGHHRETIGKAAAQRNYGARFFGNAAKPSGIVTIAGRVTDEVAEAVERRLTLGHGGANQHRVAVLGANATWTALGLPPQDSQYIESEVESVFSVCRIFRCPPHKVAMLRDAGDRANVEQENLSFATDVMLRIVRGWEAELDYKGFSSSERGRMFVKFDLRAFLRGDFKSRMDGYRIAREIGLYNADELRALEDENPIGGRAGQTYYVPINWQDGARDPDAALEPPEAPGAPPGRALRTSRALGTRRRVARAQGRLVAEAAMRIVRRESEQIPSAFKRLGVRGEYRDRAALRVWLRQFYALLERRIASTFLPTFTAFSEAIAELAAAEVGQDPPDLTQFVREYLAAFAGRYTGSHLGQIEQLLDEIDRDPDLLAAVERRTAEWLERTPGKVADREAVQAGGAFSMATWLAVGVALKRWVTFGPCPLCAQFSGRVVGMDRAFVDDGDEVTPQGGGTALIVRNPVKHPPLHQGCECAIVPG